ncbi:MAG: AMP-binding protein [Pseudomonadota bacterium]
MSTHYDHRETQPHDEREADLCNALPEFIENAMKLPGWAKHLDGTDPQEISSREALAGLPVLRKPELMALQQDNPVFGGLVDEQALSGARVFMSPGPVWEPEAIGPDPWNAARAFFAAGVRSHHLVHNALAYHATPGGFILESGALALGARVFPAGTTPAEAQVEAAAALKPDAYAGTPDFLKVILDKADEVGANLSSIKLALVSGGALFPSMRDAYKARGVAVMQCYATADIGVIAYESEHEGEPLPGMIVSEDIIVEIVRPGSDDPVPVGEVGEIVVTRFNPAYPLIRFGTGDMSAILDEPSPCGRTNLRIKGWMGRADQRTKVKGMFVDPKQIDRVVKAHAEVSGARLVVGRDGDRDVMTLQVTAGDGTPDLEAIAATLKAETRLSGRAVLTDELPNDGKVIDDTRDYES